MRRLALFLVVAAFASGCVRSYSAAPQLTFQDYPYTAVDGTPWPEKDLELPRTAAKYGLSPATRLHYVELNPEGEKTILFLHGLGSYLKFWRYQLDAYAAQGYRVLALDMLGYGKSSKPSQFPYTMVAMADVVAEFTAAVGAEKPILVGHSMGGQTALTFAIQYPDALSALVLTAPAGFEKFSRREKAWFRDVMTTRFIKSAPEGAIWGSIRRSNFYTWRDEFEWLIEERVRVVSDPAFDAYAYAQVRSVRGLSNNDFVRTNLDRVQVPTLIVHGDMDRLIPNPFMHGGETVEIMSYGHQNIAGSQLVTLEDCGHTVQMDCWERYNETVTGFLGSLGN